MSSEAPKSALSRFIEILEQGGLLSEFRDEDIADSLWLAQQMGEVTVVEDEPQSAPPSDSSQSGDSNSGNIDNSKTVVDSQPNAKLIPDEVVTQDLEQKVITETLPFQVPEAPALSRTLQIRRALRPLMRKIYSTSHFKLDAEATVTRVAEEEIWCAVMEPEQERWLDLELVVEASRSSFIWRQKVNEFLDILETHGAFRGIRMWSLAWEGQSLKLKPRYRQKAQASQREHNYKELRHPDRRGMILLVSDCVSPMWQQGRIHQWIKEWSKTTVTAVIQMFPEDRWQGTQLSLGDKAFAKAIFAGTLNEKLQLMDFPQWLLEDEDKDKTLVLPVLTMEPEMIRQWAKVQVGAAGSRIPIYRFDLPVTSTVQKDSSTKRDAEVEVTEEIAKERVNQFLATSLSVSKRLATLMAAAPVSIDVVNLIRETLLPEAQPVHVAEVYMGGLIRVVKEAPDPQQRIYDFYPEVRTVFNQAMSLDDINGVLGAITRYIAKKIDRPIRSFKALLALLPQYDQEEKQQVLPFAEVAVEVLDNLGGEYAEFAQKVRSNIERLRNQDKTSGDGEPELKSCTFKVAEFVEEDEWQTFEFEVVELEVEETVNFKFEVATLEEQQKRKELLGRETELVVSREKSEAEGIVEQLEEGVDLEMMIIPAGEFVMGAPKEEENSQNRERPQHLVKVQEFYLGRYPITQEQWRIVAGWEPVDSEIELKPDPSEFKGGERPVEQVNWLEAKEFCARLSKRTGREYRLPTEAEWEYACRAVIREQSSAKSAAKGTPSGAQLTVEEWNEKYHQPFHFGETISTELANYDGDYTYGRGVKGKSKGETTKVGYFQFANAFGLYDMHGNVFEWCEDDWHDNYKDAPTDGSAWLSGERNTTKVIRGGSWLNRPDLCRSAYRSYDNPVGRRYFLGLRVVRVAPRTQ